MSKRKNHSPEFQARRDVVEYIGLFYNPKRKHTNNGMLSSVDLEERQLKLAKGRCLETRGASNSEPIQETLLRQNAHANNS